VAWATAYADEFAEVLALLADGALQVDDQTSEIASIDGGPYRFRAAMRRERHEDPRRTERSVIPTTAGSCGSSHDFTSALSTVRSRAHRSDENRRNVQRLGARADARGAEGREALAKAKAGLVRCSRHTSCPPKQGPSPAGIHGTGEKTASRSLCMLSPRCECRVRARGAPAADDQQELAGRRPG
jgi:hypothetical protein